MKSLQWFLAFAAWLFAANASVTDQNFVVLPTSFELDGADSIQQLSIVRQLADGSHAESLKPESFELKSTDPAVACVVGDHVEAVADGQVRIELFIEGQCVSHTDVTVRNSGTPTAWTFRNDVQSVLARQGCNMGACHGALAGKGGFRLSLRGYDSDADYATIAREARGRRIEINDPGRSLLLAKPTGALPHKGGLRFSVDSRDYRVVSQWIASGAVPPSNSDAKLEKISVTPEQSRLMPGDQTRILVSGHYTDGRVVDVTHWAKFTATDESVAGVDAHGIVSVRGSGEGAILVWFGSRVQLARMTVPYPNEISETIFADAPRRNFIDELNLRQLQRLHLVPADRCDDHTFLRRVTIDTVGRLPTQQEREDYERRIASGLDTQSVRDEVIARLLASDSFVDYWTYRFSDLLLINGTKLRPEALKAYYEWIRVAIAENRPWDVTVREILTSKGVSTENGATNFFALHQSPEDMTENACQAFMGLSIGCAKCHNHPLEKWTNDQYYSMANLFARVRAKGWGGETRNGDGIRTLTVAHSGDLIQPSTGKPQPPAPLDEEPLPADDPSDRRVPLAEWMTSPENPYFARSITNRIWVNFFGRGLIDPVDDMRTSNPASNEELMSAASQHMIDVEFDLRSMMRTILQSETYQRSSQPAPGSKTEQKYLSRYYPRRLMAEVLLDAIDQTLGTTSKFDMVAFSGADKQKTDRYPQGTRAIQLADSAIDSYFLQTFGRNPREVTCDCERSDEPSMVQVLHLSNGQTLNPKLQDAQSLISRLLAEGRSQQQIVTQLFERALNRSPQSNELDAILETLEEYPEGERVTGLHDAGWSILTSTEFTFNH